MDNLLLKFINIIQKDYNKAFQYLEEQYPSRRGFLMKTKNTIISILTIIGIISVILFFAISTIDNHKESLLRQKKLQLEIENLLKPTDSQLKLEIEKIKLEQEKSKEKQLELQIKLKQINNKKASN